MPKLTHWALFTGFFQAGIMGFGGVLPVARRMIVDQRKWLTQTEFNDLFSLCQFLPGANVMNLSFAFGARHRGVSGAAAAVCGLLAAPMAIVMALGAAYTKFGGFPWVRHGMLGLTAAASGLVLGTAMRIAGPILAERRNLAVAAAMFGLVFFLRLPLPATVAIMLPISLFLSWRVQE